MAPTKKCWLTSSGMMLGCLLGCTPAQPASVHALSPNNAASTPNNTAPTPRNAVPLSAIAALENAEQYELLSLEPEQAENKKGTFHGYPILGRILITDPATRKRLTEALRIGANENQDGVMFCFEPRHGIHVVGKKSVMDFVICFHCAQVKVFDGSAPPSEFWTSSSPKPVFNAVLQKAGIPLAEEKHRVRLPNTK